VAHFIKADMVRPDAVVIDVGINSVDAPDRASGKRLVGDADTEAVSRIASYITPVPGGVGPMTIAMLLRNTLDSAERRAPSQ
jgi:methylenetetrahydrofolate dehydrogenase (NADP+)/methenyltetrahydrofolate cyclohydrolase